MGNLIQKMKIKLLEIRVPSITRALHNALSEKYLSLIKNMQLTVSDVTPMCFDLYPYKILGNHEI